MNYTDIDDVLIKNKKFNDEEQSIKNSIKNILSTREGSMPGEPEFGSNLSSFLFETMDPLVIMQIKEEIQYAIERWEPRVIIDEIDVIENLDYNELIITLRMTIKYSNIGIEYKYIPKSI